MSLSYSQEIRPVDGLSEQAVQQGGKWRGRLREGKEWARVRLRRWADRVREASAEGREAGPFIFLCVSSAVGIALLLTTMYSTSYAVRVDGQELGVVADRSVVTDAIREVEEAGSALLGRPYQVEGQPEYQFALTRRTELTGRREIEDFFYGRLDEVSGQLRKFELKLDGRSIGVLQDKDDLIEMLDGIKKRYATENTIDAGFVEDVSVEAVYTADNLISVQAAAEQLTASAVGETTYTVAQGDTFNAIAYANDMTKADLKALNPGVEVDRLRVGQVLNVKEEVPVLSVYTTDREVYNQPIECPVETVEDNTMYKGVSKILTQGEEGEARVVADVTYVNGYERERKVVSTTTLREPTTTVKAVGTNPRPKTASTGSFIWPVSGRITSYFGGRENFGQKDYHSGLDIAVPHGTRVKAADGGKVTFAGWRGSYGKLVIITHDDGTKTYYGHNSALDVSAGERVYQGQTIARVGSTGRSTGPHCHFEVRVNGSATNPLNYLP